VCRLIISEQSVATIARRQITIRFFYGDKTMLSINSSARAIAIGLTLLISGNAFAQQLEEVVVTATRRSESQQSVPISITAVSSEQLKTARVEGVRDLGVVTPGLNMNGRSNVWIPYIRGVGAQDTSGGQEASVSIYIDGVYMSSPHAGALSFNNVERVEVLKGPQGTLFGRNSTGGLINVITREPTQKTEVFGKLGFGNFKTSAAQFYVGGGISDTLTADIALNYAHQGKGYGHNVFSGREIATDGDKGVRSKWVWRPSDGTKLTWTIDYQQHDTGAGDNRALMPGSVGSDGSVHVGGYRDVNMNFPANGETDGYIKNSGTMLKVEHSFAGLDLVSISAYRRIKQFNVFDNDGLPTSVVEAEQNLNETRTFTQEIQLLSQDKSSKFNWIVGAFYMDDKSGYENPKGLQVSGQQVIPIPGAYVQFVDPISTKSIAGFAEGTYHFTDNTRLTVGARYTRDKKELGGEQRIFTVFPDILFPGQPPLFVLPPFNFSKSWTKPTFKLTLQHDVAEGKMVYGSYNRGFRSGSFNTVGVTGVPVNPETIDAFEVGLKSEWFDRRLRLNAAAFYYDFKGLQVVISRGASTDLLNAGKAEVKGAEADLQANVSEAFTLRAGVSFLDTKYKEFETGNNCSIRLANGTTIGAPPCSPKGNDLVRSPKSTFNLGLTYKKPVSFGIIGGSLDYKWTDKFFWEIDNRLVEPAYGVLNGTLSWQTTDEHWGVSLWGRNITDEKYSIFSVAQASCGAACSFNPAGIGDQYSASAPRTFGLELNFKF
jgi:iron complex outermembrane receptor protein